MGGWFKKKINQVRQVFGGSGGGETRVEYRDNPEQQRRIEELAHALNVEANQKNHFQGLYNHFLNHSNALQGDLEKTNTVLRETQNNYNNYVVEQKSVNERNQNEISDLKTNVDNLGNKISGLNVAADFKNKSLQAQALKDNYTKASRIAGNRKVAADSSPDQGTLLVTESMYEKFKNNKLNKGSRKIGKSDRQS